MNCISLFARCGFFSIFGSTAVCASSRQKWWMFYQCAWSCSCLQSKSIKLIDSKKSIQSTISANKRENHLIHGIIPIISHDGKVIEILILMSRLLNQLPSSLNNDDDDDDEKNIRTKPNTHRSCLTGIPTAFKSCVLRLMPVIMSDIVQYLM